MISQHQYIYIYFQISPTVRNEYGKQHCLFAFKCSFRFGYYLGSKFLWHFILFFSLLCIKSLRFSPPLLLLLLLNNQKKTKKNICEHCFSFSFKFELINFFMDLVCCWHCKNISITTNNMAKETENICANRVSQ